MSDRPEYMSPDPADAQWQAGIIELKRRIAVSLMVDAAILCGSPLSETRRAIYERWRVVSSTPRPEA